MPSRKKLWADSLPKSPSTGVFMTENRRFNTDGTIQPSRENEDSHFDCVFNSTTLLMVLDGHDGKNAQEYVKNAMPEVILRTVENTVSHEEIKKSLVGIFKEVDKAFFHNMDDLLTERAVIKIELDECRNSSVAAERYPRHVNRLSELNDQIKGGTTVAVAVIKHDKLYTANVGDTRVLLCLVNPQNNYLLVDQLTVDHNTSCDEELRRLGAIGLDPVKLQKAGRVGTQQNTRCIGDFDIKNGYTDVDILRDATRPPGVAEPHVSGPVLVNQNRGFVFIMSDGLYEAWSAYTDKDASQANLAIARMVATEIRGTLSMEVVARKVVNFVVSSVQSTYARSQKNECRRLDDITLLIHNMGYDANMCPLNGVVNFPLVTAPIPTMNSYFSQPAGDIHGHMQQARQYIPSNPIQHVQSYDPNFIASPFPTGNQPLYNLPAPPQQAAYQPPVQSLRAENPFVFPQPSQAPAQQQHPQFSLPPPQPSYSNPYSPNNTSSELVGVNNWSRNTSGELSSSSYGSSYQSVNHSNSYYGSGIPPVDTSSSHASQNLNSSGSSNTLLPQVNPQQQVAGRQSPNMLPQHDDQSRSPNMQVQPHPQLAANPVLQQTGDGEATPIADPISKEVFPSDQQPVKKPVPRPRTRLHHSSGADDDQNTPTKTIEQPFTEIPPPQSASTPKKDETKPTNRESADIGQLSDDALYGSGKEDDVVEKREDTLEAPETTGDGEKIEMAQETAAEGQQPETLKSSEGNQLDQYIFASDLEVSDSDQSSDTEEIDDDKMGTVDTSKLSASVMGEEPTHDQNVVHSYVKFGDNFPNLEYDDL